MRDKVSQGERHLLFLVGWSGWGNIKVTSMQMPFRGER